MAYKQISDDAVKLVYTNASKNGAGIEILFFFARILINILFEFGYDDATVVYSYCVFSFIWNIVSIV